MKEKTNYQVRFPVGGRNTIYSHELSAAFLLAEYFKADVYFVGKGISKTPDLKIKNQYWELKSPTSNGRKTIENCLREAIEQSPNVILDLRRFPAGTKIGINKTKYFMKCTPHRIKRIIFIAKSDKIIDKIL